VHLGVVGRTGREAAVRARDHVLAPDDAGVEHDRVGDRGVLREVLDEPRVVDLRQEAGLDDREVPLAKRLGDGREVLAVAAVVLVAPEAAGARRGQERLDE